MLIVHSNNPRGTALLEGVIAIGVILVGVVGSLVLLNTSINLGRANQDRIVGQNLAREGLELAYSLRNAGSMRKLEDPRVNWYSYIHGEVWKSDEPDLYLKNYNLGDLDSAHKCKAINLNVTDALCKVNGDNVFCTTENNDQVKDGLGLLASGDTDNNTAELIAAARLCDLQVYVNYIFQGWPLPFACKDNKAHANRLLFCSAAPNSVCMTEAASICDYHADGSVNIIDVTDLVDIFYRQSYVLGYGYPTINTTAGGATDGHFSPYTPFGGNLDAGNKTYVSADTIWTDARARVAMDSTSTTYVQNVTLSQPTLPTKFYRLLITQPICRGWKAGVPVEVVVDPLSVSNCDDYLKDNHGSGKFAEYWDVDVSTVGVLATSEVRWPTPTSITKVRYQEFLYDWISL